MRQYITLVESLLLSEQQFQSYPRPVLFTDWSEFGQRLKSILGNGVTDYVAVCKAVGIDYALFAQVIDHAVRSWRDSTTTSTINGIAHMRDLPKAGEQVFPDLAWQTRFLMKMREVMPVSTVSIPNPDFDIKNPASQRFIVIKSTKALSVDKLGEEKVNQFLQIIYLYYHVNQHKKVKLPKVLYRGIRAPDLFNHPTFKPIIAEIIREDGEKYHFYRKRVVDALLDYIIDNGLENITNQNLYSFTASMPTAKYFSRGTGFILKVDTARVEIISSEQHDPENLKGGTYETRNKDEREYIVRIPSDYRFAREDIIMADLEYLVAQASPLAVEYFDHNDKEATYIMHGRTILAKFQWNNAGTSGSVRFRIDGDWWAHTRAEAKKILGFDPMPTEKNLDEISNFEIKEVKSW